MIHTETTDAAMAQADYICIAGDVLNRIMSELATSVATNARLRLATATVGHEIRQGLHSLMLTIELLTSADGPGRRAEIGQRARSGILRLADELKHVALQESGVESEQLSPAKRSFELAPILERVDSEWHSEARAKRIGFSIARTAAMVESDPYLLAVIVNNVVANAVRYTYAGNVCVECNTAGDRLILEVKDTGPGIPDAVLQCTSADQRVRPTGNGLGIGLSIVRRTADLLGHSLTFSTGPCNGTCVRLSIPLARQKTRPSDMVQPL